MKRNILIAAIAILVIGGAFAIAGAFQTAQKTNAQSTHQSTPNNANTSNATNQTVNTNTNTGTNMNMGTSTNVNATSSVPAAQYCSGLAGQIGGLAIPNGDVCDVVVVRKAPIIVMNGMNLNKFTLMNSVIEFMKPSSTPDQAFVMGDFALLETEMNPVLDLLTQYHWTITGIHNHMILESPKTTFMHWEVTGNVNTIVTQINNALAKTSIKG